MCDLWLLAYADMGSCFRQTSLDAVCLVFSRVKRMILASFTPFPVIFWVLSQCILPPTAFKCVQNQI